MEEIPVLVRRVLSLVAVKDGYYGGWTSAATAAAKTLDCTPEELRAALETIRAEGMGHVDAAPEDGFHLTLTPHGYGLGESFAGKEFAGGRVDEPEPSA